MISDKKIVFVGIILLFVSTFCYPSSKLELVNKLLDKSGVTLAFNSYPDQYRFNAALRKHFAEVTIARAKYSKFPRSAINREEKKLALFEEKDRKGFLLIDTQKNISITKSAIVKKLSVKEIRELLRWFSSPLGKKIHLADISLFAPDLRKNIYEYLYWGNPDFSDTRINVLSSIDHCQKISDRIFRSYLAKYINAVNKNKIKKLRGINYKNLVHGLRLNAVGDSFPYIVYKYRNFSEKELRDYQKFVCNSPAMNKFISILAALMYQFTLRQNSGGYTMDSNLSSR